MDRHPLRQYRMTNGFSREAMSRKIGVSASMIQQVEGGLRKLSAERSIAIERATGLPRSMFRPDLWADYPSTTGSQLAAEVA